MRAKMNLSLGLLAAAILSACGGGGSTSTSNDAGSSTLTGVVIDGPIKGATVCLDLNNNLACDTDEPTDTTKAKGAYSLNIAGLSAAQLRDAHLFVTVPIDAVDEDDGTQTLEQAGKAPFNLLAPANAYVTEDGKEKTAGSAVISPMTTLISHEMMSGNSTTMEAAEVNVKSRLGLEGSFLQANYSGASDAASKNLQYKARLLAAALGEIKKKIGMDLPASSEREKLLGALDHLSSAKGKDLINLATLGVAGGSAPTKVVQDLLVIPTLTPDSTTLVSNANTVLNTSPVLGASAADFAKTLGEGFYEVYCAVSSESICSKWHLYQTKASGPDTWRAAKFYNLPTLGTSFIRYDVDENEDRYSQYYLTANNGWVGDSAATRRGTYAYDSATGLVGVTNSATGDASKVRMSAKDLSGKKIADLTHLGGYMASTLGYLNQTARNTVLPQGSKYVTKMVDYGMDEYQIQWEVARWNCAQSPCTSTSLTSFADLFQHYATPAQDTVPSGMLFGFTISKKSGYTGPNYEGTFDSEGRTDTGGTITVWKSQSGAAPTRLNEKVNYSIQTIHGQQVLVIAEPTSVRDARVANNGLDNGNPIFAVRGGKLYGGLFTTAPARSKAPAGHGQFNATAMDAIVKAAGATAGLPQSILAAE